MEHYVERPPAIAACSYKDDGSDIQEFIRDASWMLGEVNMADVQYEPRFGDIKSVIFKLADGEEVKIKPGTVLCRERVEGSKAFTMDSFDFKRKYIPYEKGI